MIWLYSQEWFLNFAVFGVNMRDLFGVHTINLSVAIWVGLLALFGIASDDGVVMCTYLEQSFRGRRVRNTEDVQEAVITFKAVNVIGTCERKTHGKIGDGLIFATDLVLLTQLNFSRAAEQANVGSMSLGEVSCAGD